MAGKTITTVKAETFVRGCVTLSIQLLADDSVCAVVRIAPPHNILAGDEEAVIDGVRQIFRGEEALRGKAH